MTDLSERLEEWVTGASFLSFREADLLLEAADAVRNLGAEVDTLRIGRADNIRAISRNMTDACSAARLAGRAEALEDAAFACDETAREYRRRAESSVAGMLFEREWRLCADAAHTCGESIRGLLPRRRNAAE